MAVTRRRVGFDSRTRGQRLDDFKTTLEDICRKTAVLKVDSPNKSGNTSAFFGEVQRLYFGDVAGTAEGKALEKFLDVYNRMQPAVSNFRIIGSTFRGAGTDRVNLDVHHVRLYVNSYLTLAGFMLEVLERLHTERGRVFVFTLESGDPWRPHEEAFLVSRHKQNGFFLNKDSPLIMSLFNAPECAGKKERGEAHGLQRVIRPYLPPCRCGGFAGRDNCGMGFL